MRRSLILLGLLLIVPAPRAQADELGEGLFVRVVDVGAGLCCIIRIPDDQGWRYIVYDAGNYKDRGATAMRRIRELIPEDSTIDLLVLSHSDADHLGAVPEICEEYRVQEILRAGFERDTATWRNADAAVAEEVADEDAFDFNLFWYVAPIGWTWQVGDVEVSVPGAWYEPPGDWDIDSSSESRNAGSIILRLAYADRAVLLTGDSVGRHLGDPANACLATEKFLVDHSAERPIAADVIVAPHHGSDGGSAKCFVRAVNPSHVVFSAGHAHQHPTAQAAQRYMAEGVGEDSLFRTDRGDDEGGFEWAKGRTPGAKDPAGDDDVDIAISPSGVVSVGYRYTEAEAGTFMLEEVALQVDGALETFSFAVRPPPSLVTAPPTTDKGRGMAGPLLIPDARPEHLERIQTVRSAFPRPVGLESATQDPISALDASLSRLRDGIKRRRGYSRAQVDGVRLQMAGVWRRIAVAATAADSPEAQVRSRGAMSYAAEADAALEDLGRAVGYSAAREAHARLMTGLSRVRRTLGLADAAVPAPLFEAGTTPTAVDGR